MKTNLFSLCLQKISDKEMDIITGGDRKLCQCACFYEDQGGASTADNMSANYEIGGSSSQGCNIVKKTGDGWIVIAQNHE